MDFKFCPNSKCNNYPAFTASGYIKYGRDRYGNQRYQCKSCGRIFSARTFSIHFYEHQNHLFDYRILEWYVHSGLSIRSISRFTGLSVKSVLIRLAKLSRNVKAFNAINWGNLNLKEDLVADGIVNFVGSQYAPCEFNILVGAESEFVYAYSYCLTRRRGTMTERQKKRNLEFQKNVDYETYTISAGFQVLVDRIVDLLDRSELPQIILDTDEKPQYQTVLQRDSRAVKLMEEGKLIHRVTNSKAPRTKKNPLAAVNYMEREVRNNVKCFFRETFCFPRSVSNCNHLLDVYFDFHNFRKQKRINAPVAEKHLRHRTGVISDSDELILNREKVYENRSVLEDVEEKIHPRDVEHWKMEIPTPNKSAEEKIPWYNLNWCQTA